MEINQNNIYAQSLTSTVWIKHNGFESLWEFDWDEYNVNHIECIDEGEHTLTDEEYNQIEKYLRKEYIPTLIDTAIPIEEH